MIIINPLTGKQPADIVSSSSHHYPSSPRCVTVYEHPHGKIQSQVFVDKYFSAFVHDLHFDHQACLDIYNEQVLQFFVVPVTGNLVWEEVGNRDLAIREKHLCFMPSIPESPAKMIVPKGASRVWTVILQPHYLSLLQKNLSYCYRRPRLLHPYELQRLQELQCTNATVPFMLKRRVTLLGISFNVIEDIMNRNFLPVADTYGQAVQISQAKEYIALNFRKRISLNQVAAHVGLSRPQLYRGFKIVYGITPQCYLRDERLYAAKQLLAETNASVQEIAWEVGYESAAGFTRIFTEQIGMAPSAYRRSGRSNSNQNLTAFPIC